MAYASAQDMKDRYPAKDLRELTDENGAVIDDAALDRALADASAEIDGYLRGRYTLPLSSIPLELKNRACEVGFYYLVKSRPGITMEDVEKRYDKIIAWMRDVSRGTVQLDVDALGGEPAQSSGPQVMTADRVFTRDNMRNL